MLCVEKGILIYRKKNEIIIIYVDGMWHWVKNEYKPDLGVFAPSKCNVVHLFLYWTLFHYTFLSNWPSSGVQVVMVKLSAAHCNAVFFLSIVVVSCYFWLCGFHVVAYGYVRFVGCGCFECSCCLLVGQLGRNM
jgi:hypothetical protein